jgi:hypothetical protein
MKATLEFSLPNDKWEFKMANESAAMHSVIWDMDKWLRKTIKHAPDSMDRQHLAAMELCRDQLHLLLSQESVNLDER